MPKHLTESNDFIEDGTHKFTEGELYFPLRTTIHDVTDPTTGEVYYVPVSGILVVYNGADWDLFRVTS